MDRLRVRGGQINKQGMGRQNSEGWIKLNIKSEETEVRDGETEE